MTAELIGAGDPPPFETINEDGGAALLLICDHASCAVPEALGTLGLDEAIRRGHAFAEAGADVIFVEAPESVDELRQVGGAFNKPVLANMADKGHTPILSADELREMGFSIAIFPGLGMLVVGAALDAAYRALLKDGTSANVKAPMMELADMHRIMGFEDVWAFERKWARDEAAD